MEPAEKLQKYLQNNIKKIYRKASIVSKEKTPKLVTQKNIKSIDGTKSKIFKTIGRTTSEIST